ncbi:hypothetical protein Clacol_001082 [Clathrus columnatus]|uniref:Jacalin-type lectin domain-containing protein n=1 Tax=Clathrus columnatus TaxID=1419009 RepID=A0AAV4ZXL3_9AGAM|nr:hypothetical protein Clacol_001082 [Clathrus columnatus]
MSSPAYITTSFKGGQGGTEFNDAFSQPEIRDGRVVKVNYWYISILKGIQLEWETPRGKTIKGRVHGETVGFVGSFSLSNGERIICLTGRSGTKMDALTMITNKGRSRNFGGNGGSAFQWAINLTKYPNAAFHHFRGRSGDVVDALEAIFITENVEAAIAE